MQRQEPESLRQWREEQKSRLEELGIESFPVELEVIVNKSVCVCVCVTNWIACQVQLRQLFGMS